MPADAAPRPPHGAAFASLVDILRWRAQHQPDQRGYTFLTDGETEKHALTYAALDARVRTVAAVLQQHQARGERVLLLFPAELDFVAAFFGCLYAGAIAIPVYARLNRFLGQLHAIVQNAEPTLVLTDTDTLAAAQPFLPDNPALAALHWLDVSEFPASLADEWQPPRITGDELAFLQYTSGSTSAPKGVMVSHANLLHNSECMHSSTRTTPDSVSLSWLPHFHDLGLIAGILQPMYTGFHAYLMPPTAFLQRPFRWLQAVSTFGITFIGAPNFAYDLCAQKITPEQRDTLDLSKLTVAITGAEPIHLDTLERFHTMFAPCGFNWNAFYPTYGMAEATLQVSGGGPDTPPLVVHIDRHALADNRVLLAPPDHPDSQPAIGCGPAVLDQELVIVHPDSFTRCAPDEVGEIWVRGPSIAGGYWGQPEVSQRTFAAHLADTGAGPFMRTGDLGFLHQNELFITGRLKDIIIVRGRNYYPQDIERTLEASHPSLLPAASAAFAVQVDNEERLVVVAEAQRPYRDLDVNGVVASVRQAIAEQHDLAVYAVVLLRQASIPKTTSNKIRRSSCREMFLEGTLHSVGSWQQEAPAPAPAATSAETPAPTGAIPAAPAGNKHEREIQAWLVAQLAQRLHIAPHEIDMHEPFARYGLGSVEAVQLSGDLEQWLGATLPPTLAYEYPTVAALARYLAGSTAPPETDAIQPAAPQPEGDAVAIVGMACRFPGAPDLDAFWQLLHSGQEAVGAVPPDRWNNAALYDPDPDAPGKLSTQRGGFLGQVDLFDAPFFGIAPREAHSLDPQQRLLLEVAWEALEHAGEAPDQLTGSRTGVFVGISGSDYTHLHMSSGDPTRIDPYSGTGSALSIAAGRLAYVLGLQGPALAIDTACSSSLVAVHTAVQNILTGACQMALAGGVNLMLSPETTIYLSKTHALSPQGRCKTFDAAADGYVRGEGCGVVVLKRLSAAQADGNRILGVIRGAAVNQDGRSNGLTVPNGTAQQALIREAVQQAGIAPAHVDYIEAHGTGTPLGDPIEVRALGAVLAQGRSADQALALGSVKTNIGHLEAAAGVAGLIKLLLALEHGEIPPHPHLHTPNPHLGLESIPATIPTTPTPWPARDGRRVGGVSSFGFSGTNAHLIIMEKAAGRRQHDEATSAPYLLTVSAKSEAALRALAHRYADHLNAHPALSLADVCYTANTGRAHLGERLALLASSREELHAQLQQVASGESAPAVVRGRATGTGTPAVVWLFTGQGSQYPGMGRDLYETQPVFRAALQQCADLLQPYLEHSLLDVLYSAAAELHDLLHQTAYTQPALFALEYALAHLWRSWGIEPAAVMGHSIGEYVAACVAGVFSLPDALRLVAERGRLMQALPAGGAMASIAAPLERVQQALAAYGEHLAIAALNAPEQVVISGAQTALEEVTATLEAEGYRVRRLFVSHAFHSPLMQPMQEAFADVARSISYAPPQIDLIANTSGQRIAAGAPGLDADYWVRHVREPVQFAASVQTARQLTQPIGSTLFLELGPHPTLVGLGQQTLLADETDAGCSWLASLKRESSDWQELLHALAGLYVQGVPVSWRNVPRDESRQRVVLPTYPFQRQRYWLDAPARRVAAPVAGAPVLSGTTDIQLYQTTWQPVPVPPATPPAQQQHWLILSDAPGDSLAAELARHLESGGGSVHVLLVPPTLDTPQTAAALQSLAHPLAGIVCLWETTPDTPTARERLTLEHLLLLVQQMPARPPARLLLVTRHTQPVGDVPVQNPHDALFWGFGHTLALEHPELRPCLVDLGVGSNPQEVPHLLAELHTPDSENRVAYRNGQRYVARLAPAAPAPSPAAPVRIKADATYLVTGGLGGLGLLVARWLVEQGARSLVLLSRRALMRAPEAAIKAVGALEAQGARVAVLEADATRRDEVVRVLAEIEAIMPPLQGIFHAAGVLDDGLLEQQTGPRMAAVLAPKVTGAWNLHTLTRHLEPDLFVLFSSAAAVLGSPGQVAYTAANAFLDALAHQRRAAGLPAHSINWGPWAELGMAAATVRQTRQGAAHLLAAIQPEQGLRTLAHLLSRPEAQLLALPATPADLTRLPLVGDLPLLADLRPAVEPIESPAPAAPAEAPADTIAYLVGLPAEERHAWIHGYLKQQIAAALQSDPAHLGDDENILNMGIDSLMVMSIINDCKKCLGLTLYPRELYERPFLGALARYVTSEFERFQRVGEPDQPASGAPAVLPAALADQPATPADPVITERNGPVALLLSSPRAGSTLLRVMLAGHPALFCPPELHLLLFGTMPQRQQQLGASYLDEGLQRALMELEGLDSAASRAAVEELTRQHASIQQVYARLQQQAHPRLLVDKSPSYASSPNALHRAEQLFTDARYIHLLRHPYAMIDSFVRNRMEKLIGQDTDDPYRLAEHIWHTTTVNLSNFLATLPAERVHTLRYEDLVRDPASSMQALCGFLGVPFDAATLRPYDSPRMTDGIHSESLGLGDPNFLQHTTIDPALGDVWQHIRLPRPLQPDTQQLAATFGYELPNEPVIAIHPVPTLPAGEALPQQPMREYTVQRGDLDLCVCEWGPADGPPLVCVHGILFHGGLWEAVAQPLAAAGWRIIAPDLRGHGRSAHAPAGSSYHLLDFVADLDAVVRAALGPQPQPMVLVGHSLGSLVAALLARARPEYVRSLVLVEYLWHTGQRSAGEQDVNTLALHLDQLAAPPQHTPLPDVAAAAARLQQAEPALSPEWATRMAERLTEPEASGGVRWRWDALLSTRAGLTLQGVPGAASPLELVQAVATPDRSPVVVVEGSQSNAARPLSVELPALVQRVVLTGGHNLPVEEPGALADVIRQAAEKWSGFTQ